MKWLLLTLVSSVACSQNNDWDFLIFTQQWPNTACLQYEENGSDHVCKLATPDSWTVHGVWPTKVQTEGPGFCNSSIKFDPQQLTPIREELLTSWPSVQGGKKEWVLWRHEWLKHGSCAMTLEGLDTEIKYFTQGLEWFHQFNMTGLLAKNDIVPSDSVPYHVQDIHDAVIKELHITPRIQCAWEVHTKTPYLMEIRICFDKNFTLRGCEGTLLESTAKPLTNCPLDLGLHYPKVMSALPMYSRRRGHWLHAVLDVLVFLDWVI